MKVEFDAIAAYMGTLYGAARGDLKAADPAEVGLGGIPIVQWRQAYLEACKDMIEGIITRVPDEQREEVKAAVIAAIAGVPDANTGDDAA